MQLVPEAVSKTLAHREPVGASERRSSVVLCWMQPGRQVLLGRQGGQA